MPDTFSYLAAAQNLLEHGAFLNSDGLPDTIRTPGFPLLIALSQTLNLGLMGVIVLQHLSVFTIGCFAGVIVKRYGPTTILFCTGLTWYNLLLAIYPNFLLSEIWFTMLTTAALTTLIVACRRKVRQAGYVAAAALLFGCAILVRPIGLFLFIPATLSLLLFLKAGQRRLILVFLILFSLAPISWMARNYVLTDQFTLSNITDVNLLGYQAAGTLAMRDGGDYATALERNKQELMQEASTRYAAQPTANRLSLSKIRRSMSLDIFKAHPGSLALHLLRNTGASLLGNASTILQALTGWSQKSAMAAAGTLAAAMLLLAFFGLVLLIRNGDTRLAVVFVLFAGYYVGLAAVGGVGGSRFRIPAEPIFCILAGIALSRLLAKVTTLQSDNSIF
ncbi:hypothetical protein [Pseudodesulfovibrio sp.]|uniref:hypothetical protein n=1 Tax=unclassified Pseudodesulfovibrio TaxID=2661612 RepID=UPI003B002DB2